MAQAEIPERQSTDRDIEMKDVENTGETNKRHRNTETQQHRETTSRNTGEQQMNTPPQKKPFGSYGIRQETATLRMDYPGARSKSEAYRSWLRIINELRRCDKTTIVHSRDSKQILNITDLLPSESKIKEYTDLTVTKKPIRQAEAYASIMTLITSRPIHKLKRLFYNLFEVLKSENVFIRKTNLDTTNMVEIGFFLGLHPSLTNLEWRHQQLQESVGLTTGPKFQIYRRRLREGHAQTLCIVLSCARKDMNIIQEKFMNYKAHTLGKDVEFIAYQMASIWSQDQYMQIFQQQNQFMEEIGAVPIQGIAEHVMKNGVEQDMTVQQYLIAHEKILSVEKSNTPGKQKWWILMHKHNLPEVTEFLNGEAREYLHQQEEVKQTYQPPHMVAAYKNCQGSTTMHRYMETLQQRLTKRSGYQHIQKISGEEESSSRKTVPNGSPTHTIERVPNAWNKTLQQDLQQRPAQLTQSTVVTETVTEPSTLTNTETRQWKMQEMVERQTKQMDKMMDHFDTSMQTMQQMFTMMTNSC